MITLKTKDGTKVGNGIIFRVDTEFVDGKPSHRYWVETDFGNKVKFSWEEIEKLYTLGEPISHTVWCQDRYQAQYAKGH